VNQVLAHQPVDRSQAPRVISVNDQLGMRNAATDATAPVGQLVPRQGFAQGIWSPYYSNLIGRAINPGLYEVMRESIPMLDAAIDRTVMLDGVPIIVGEDKALVQEASEWAESVQVGDVQRGLASFAQNWRNEAHEQGFGVPEFILNETGTDVVRLNVADSKQIYFARGEDGRLIWYFDPRAPMRNILGDGGLARVRNILENRYSSGVISSVYSSLGFIELDTSNLLYMSYHNENADPYGVSMLRSMPLVAKSLLTIENGLLNVWERFGDPSFHLSYKSGSRAGSAVDANGDTPLEARRKKLATGLASAITAKRAGKSADFVTAVDKDSEVVLTVIGGDGHVLECEMPARHLQGQILAKAGLPDWMLGVPGASTQRMSGPQSEIIKQESDTRTSIEAPHLECAVKAMFRARGRTWSEERIQLESGRWVRKAWRMDYLKPNLADVEKLAKANFMNAQAELVRSGGSVAQEVRIPASEEDDDGTTMLFKPAQRPAISPHARHKAHLRNALETRPFDNPALDIVEEDAVRGVTVLWNATRERALTLLGLPARPDGLPGGESASASTRNGLSPEGFTFTETDKAKITEAMAGFAEDALRRDIDDIGPVANAQIRSWAQGVMDAYAQSGLDAPLANPNNLAAVGGLRGTASTTFTTNIEKRFSPKLWKLLEAGVKSGENPVNIARSLREEFDGFRWKFEQIARSEVAMAHDAAKRDEFGAEVADGAIEDKFDWIAAPDACPQCISMASVNPYTLAALPRPVIDTHPSDRCTTAPSVQE